MGYCMYLRKSRADEQAESFHKFDTLRRHQDILFELSKKLNLQIDMVFREIVSGDSIEARPVMQELLAQVERKLWDGVFVMEVERLARGDTVDQGVVARTFKYSETKIITPIKIYDPCNEFDEEYFEFGLFMSRREYKVINRRLQRGRLSSVREGKFPGSVAPYGYNKLKLKGEKGFTLEINRDSSAVVKLIFDLFLKGIEKGGSYEPLGTSKISDYLNSNGIPSPGNKKWTPSTVYGILTNPVYAGKIRWNYRPALKSVNMGKMKTERRRNAADKFLIFQGLHKNIISADDFEKAQKKISSYHKSPINRGRSLKNPLAGIVICKNCGSKLLRKPDKNERDYVVCPNRCGNVSCFLTLLEKKITDALAIWLNGYRIDFKEAEKFFPVKDESVKSFSFLSLENRERNLQNQLQKVYSLFERGIYSSEVFEMRKENLIKAINEVKDARENFELKTNQYKTDVLFTEPMEIMELYQKTSDAEIKNLILKELLYKVEYKKEKSARWNNSPDAFEIIIYPKIPKH